MKRRIDDGGICCYRPLSLFYLLAVVFLLNADIADRRSRERDSSEVERRPS
jgi:hypothetical protein